MALEHAEMPAEGDMVLGAHKLAREEQHHMLVQQSADVGRLRRIGLGQSHASHLRAQRRREAFHLPIARRHGCSLLLAAVVGRRASVACKLYFETLALHRGRPLRDHTTNSLICAMSVSLSSCRRLSLRTTFARLH